MADVLLIFYSLEVDLQFSLLALLQVEFGKSHLEVSLLHQLFQVLVSFGGAEHLFAGDHFGLFDE